MTSEPIFETIARGKPREPLQVTRARRFVRKATARGVSISPAIQFRAAYVIIQTRTRVIRIDSDGWMVHTSADPQARANYARSHAHHLYLARRFRLRGQRRIALAALANCARDRREAAPLPA